MSVYFYILGILSVIGSIVVGIESGAILISIIFGIFTGSIFGGIGWIIEGQKEIQNSIQHCINYMKVQKEVESIQCEQCGKLYQADRASCPYCGNRNNK